VGKTGILSEIGWMARSRVKRAKNIMILGGGKIGFAIAKILDETNSNISVKLIEKSENRCYELSESCQKPL
jgi:trk system potassium uptake protein TrkA